MHLDAFWICLVIAVATSSIAVTMSQTEIFAPWRVWTNKLHPKLGYLFQCFYCIKHWVIFLAIAIYRPVLFDSGYHLADLIVSAFFTITLSTYTSGFMFQSFLLAFAKKVKEQEVKEFFAQKQ